MTRVAVAGATGYAGGEVLRLLLGHPAVEIGALTAGASAGGLLGDHQPHLVPLADRVIEPTTPEVLAGHDVVFLALPHGTSGQIADALPQDVLVVDISADHRLVSPAAWQEFYGSTHPGTWPYGMPELLVPGGKQRDKLTGVRRLAIPGCYPTSVSLALAPALASGLVLDEDLVVVAASGPSGAGKSLQPHLLGSELMGSMTPYGVGGGHRHTPEIEQNLASATGRDPDSISVSFTPTLAPMPRGILATCTARLAGSQVTEEALRQAYRQAYDDEPFVHLLPAGRWPRTADTLGANTVHLQLTVDRRVGRLIVVAAVDNLTKGTGGAGVQCMNLALGLPETTGLATAGVAP